jgi:hypothetical protein
MKQLTQFTVGQPFPVPVPQQEGGYMVIWDSLVIVINMLGVTKWERLAFEKGFKRYSYLECDSPVPIALWVFDFPGPHGPIDVNFNSRVENIDRVKNYLELENGKINNTCQFFLIDEQILKAIKIINLDPEAVNLFQTTIRKQLETEYTQNDYDRYLAGMQNFSLDELLQMGRQFMCK